MNKLIVIVTGILILVAINYSIWQKERHINEGEMINIALAPVDPRSLMQGDYMALRYSLGNDIQDAIQQKARMVQSERDDYFTSSAYVVVELDANNQAHFVSLYDNMPLLAEQRILEYRVRNEIVKFASNAFFFAEGDEPLYRNAKFGQFKLNKQGEVLLVSMLDANFELIRSE